MHVTRVELENIKSYERADFQFERGTTAITGENGAGKTTILEAIAWALFDTLEYSKEDFLRRGAKKGSVRVTFESDLDGRQYTIYRDTGQGYYVYDPGLGIRLAEKKTDVSATLRKLLGIEPGTDLKALFNSAIGVPQGTFTADFLRPSNQRKAAFDRLLKVEEYREGADRLRETVNLIRERAAEARGRIAGAESQLARYDELVEEHRGATARVQELDNTLGQLQREIGERLEIVARMDAAELRLNELRLRSERLDLKCEEARRRLDYVRGERDAASAAFERRREAEADHLAHLEALGVLGRLETERAARDALRKEEENVARLLLSAQSDVRRLQEAVERATQAGVEAGALEPEVGRQEELERERERLRDLRAQALSARERLAQIEAELAALRTQHAQTQKRLREAQAGAGAQEAVARLESERMEIETLLSRLERAATSQKHLASQRQDAVREAERLRRAVAKLEQEAAGLEKHSVKAAQASRLDARERELTQSLANLRAEVQRDEKFHAEVRNGLCPILSQRCLNLREGETLETYFKGQMATNTAQIGAMEAERTKINAAVREAREAEKLFSRLESTRQQLGEQRRLLTEREAAIGRIEKELAALLGGGAARLQETGMKLLGIDGELKALREAELRYAELQPLQQRLKEIEQEGKRKSEDRAGLAAVVDGLPTLEKEMGETEEKLRALGDPRSRAARLREEALRGPALKAEAEGAMDAQRALAEQSQALAMQLEQYVRLDREWDEARGRRDRTLTAHHQYLANQTLAEALPARQAEAEKAEAESSQAITEAAGARQEYERSAGLYHRDEHMNERAALAGARERAASASAQMEAAQANEASLGAELARLAKVRDEMREELRARERLDQLNDTTDFIRDTLKKAGPEVAKSYLYNISIEANQLFREITGEAGRALRWSLDYDILLEEEGHERSFPNLSGGEQMAAALSVRLALLKQLSDIRLAFFDEPTVNMDAERRERLAQQIGQVRDFDQLFVISHDDTFEGSVDHIVHVKRKGVTHRAGEEPSRM